MKHSVRTVSLGALSDKVWPGKLSHRGCAITAEDLLVNLDKYYIPVESAAVTRCIDGRHDPRVDENKLGPQVPAGALGSSLAYRLGVDGDDLTRGTFYNDSDMMISYYMRMGMSPGGHRDNIERESGVGCGAIDGVSSILNQLLTPDFLDDLKRISRSLLAGDFNREHFLRILGAAVMLQSRAEGYFAQNSRILELLEERDPGSVITLEGDHRESFVIFNLVPGTTLASNRFANDHGGHQAFGYDLWRSKELARALFPLPSQDVDKQRFVMARVMITVATLMSLTDGTLPLIVRAPEIRRLSI